MINHPETCSISATPPNLSTEISESENRSEGVPLAMAKKEEVDHKLLRL